MTPAYRRKCNGSRAHSSTDVAVENDAARLLRRCKASTEKAAIHAVAKGGHYENSGNFRSVAHGKIELLAMETKIALKLPELPEGAPERLIALTNLRNIRRVLINRAQLSRGP